MRQNLFFLLIVSSCFFYSACGLTGTDGDKIDEGLIKFNIEYLDDEKENPVISLLPTEMTLKFKKSSTVAKINGFFGVFSMSYITDATKNINLTLLKIMDKKYMYEIDTSGQAVGYEQMVGLQVQKTQNTKMVAGYLCYEARIVCPEGREGFSVYYTNDLDIKGSNKYNPFKDIDGVLLEFRANLNNINMKFTAKEVVETKIENTEFSIPEDYKKVSKDEMQAIVDGFNSTAN